MITASHNPKEYNGYKLYDDKGCQLIPCLASQVIDKVNAIEDELAIDANCTEEQKKLITVIGKDVDEEYYKNVLSIQLNPEVKKISKSYSHQNMVRQIFQYKKFINVQDILAFQLLNNVVQILIFKHTNTKPRTSRCL